jgi:acetolactate decarboxylase
VLSADDTAGFLVTASVPAWQPVPITENVNFDDLPEAVEELASRAGLDVQRPFPFLIDGALANLEFNVADGRNFPTGVAVTRDELMVSAAKSKFASIEGTIVGFFGKGEHPAFLHPDTHLHLHVIVPSEKKMGHVDRVDLPRGVTVRVPLPR